MVWNTNSFTKLVHSVTGKDTAVFMDQGCMFQTFNTLCLAFL